MIIGMRNHFRKLLTVALFLCLTVPLRSGGVISGRGSCPSSGASTVITAGTSTPVAWAAIQAPFANAGNIYIGASGVTSTTGIQLQAGGSLTLQTKGNANGSYDLGKNVYFACSNANDAVVYVAAQ